MGNSKVIWIVNRMISWGYCVVSKIKTKEPTVLEISVKKAENFQKVCDDFELVKAEKVERFKALKS